MAYYPVFLQMTDRPCLVVGGGAVAERKVEGLLRVGARVTVLSPILTDRLRARVADGRVSHMARRHRPGDLLGFHLVFVATDDVAVTAAVADEGRARGIWVNAADDPAHCDFILPSVLTRGELTVAVGTGGSSPAFSRAIREELEGYFTPDYAALAALVSEVRRELRGRASAPGGETWRRALRGDLRRLIAEGRRGEAKRRLVKRLASG